MIPVTKSFLPPIEEYMVQVKRAFDNEWLTNRGDLVRELESKLTNYLGLEESKIICMNNGTIPLQIALKIFGNEGEIITTPFSYVATTAAIVWENCTPVFVDIHPEYLTIDESKIEAAVTDKTTCILATHVFGNPCNIEAIEEIAKKYQLKVIYDAAHCFGVTYKGKSIFHYGDISTCSFHATKLFHTGEGGALFCKDPEVFHKSFYSHNFGHDGSLSFHGLGINGKISELHGALGLSVLPYLDSIIEGRKRVVHQYETGLDVAYLHKMKLREGTVWNYSYYPVLFPSEASLIKVQKSLNQIDVFPRRYFYPSLNKLPYLNNSIIPVSEDIVKRILCLPVYWNLEMSEVNEIMEIIRKNIF
jgi:dTDP-4-amino-4,6-dideoxygalactose transaminase